MTACITVSEKSILLNSRWFLVTLCSSFGGITLSDLIVFGRILMGSSREILRHLRAKFAGKLGTGMTLMKRRNFFSIGKARVSGKTSSLSYFSSVEISLISLFSSATFFCWS